MANRSWAAPTGTGLAWGELAPLSSDSIIWLLRPLGWAGATGEDAVLGRLCRLFISLSAGGTSVCKTLSGLPLSAVGAGGEGKLPWAASSWKEPSLWTSPCSIAGCSWGS